MSGLYEGDLFTHLGVCAGGAGICGRHLQKHLTGGQVPFLLLPLPQPSYMDTCGNQHITNTLHLAL